MAGWGCKIEAEAEICGNEREGLTAASEQSEQSKPARELKCIMSVGVSVGAANAVSKARNGRNLGRVV